MGLTKDEERQILLLLEQNNQKIIEQMKGIFVSREQIMKGIILILCSAFIGGKIGLIQEIVKFITS